MATERLIELGERGSRAPARPRADPRAGDELLARCRNGDVEAFGELFDLYRDYVYSVARYLTRDDDLSSEIVQEVFLKLLRRIDRFGGRARFSTWLYRVVCNAVWDARRAVRPEVPLDQVAAPEAPPERAPGARLRRRQSAERVRDAIEGLSDRLREPVVLRYVAGLSYDEIARVLGISPGTVASRLHRAHRELARLIPRDEVEVP